MQTNKQNKANYNKKMLFSIYSIFNFILDLSLEKQRKKQTKQILSYLLKKIKGHKRIIQNAK